MRTNPHPAVLPKRPFWVSGPFQCRECPATGTGTFELPCLPFRLSKSGPRQTNTPKCPLFRGNWRADFSHWQSWTLTRSLTRQKPMAGHREDSGNAEPSSRFKSDRRKSADRRLATRGGRRADDPQPRCPSCGLLVPDAPHATETACVKALRAELERLIAAVPLDPQNE